MPDVWGHGLGSGLINWGEAVGLPPSFSREQTMEWKDKFQTLHKHYLRLQELRDDPTTPYWLACMIHETNDHDPVDVWVGLKAVLSIYDDHMAEMQRAVEDMGLDS